MEAIGRRGSAERSRVVWAGVLQVVELQLQLAYSHVLGGQLILQPPQLVLLPEEHPQELEVEGEEGELTTGKQHESLAGNTPRE